MAAGAGRGNWMRGMRALAAAALAAGALVLFPAPRLATGATTDVTIVAAGGSQDGSQGRTDPANTTVTVDVGDGSGGRSAGRLAQTGDAPALAGLVAAAGAGCVGLAAGMRGEGEGDDDGRA